jgi:hypothetical protein
MSTENMPDLVKLSFVIEAQEKAAAGKESFLEWCREIVAYHPYPATLRGMFLIRMLKDLNLAPESSYNMHTLLLNLHSAKGNSEQL